VVGVVGVVAAARRVGCGVDNDDDGVGVGVESVGSISMPDNSGNDVASDDSPGVDASVRPLLSSLESPSPISSILATLMLPPSMLLALFFPFRTCFWSV
jgi:hypothetical protein